MTDEPEEEGEVVYLVPPKPGEKVDTWLEVDVECDDADFAARLRALVNKHLGGPPPDDDT